jgi:hypothetical protein
MQVKRGFKAVKEEEKRREQAREQRQGRLWRVFFPKNASEDFEIPVRFLTNEPICFYEHTKNVNGKIVNITCTGDGCEECAGGDKPRFVGAFLVIDRTEFEYEERDAKGNKTGKKLKGKDRLKLLVRGQQDLAVLDRLNSKYGLLDRDWNVYKTGTDTSTKWNFDRGDIDEWTEEELNNILPEKFRGKDLYEIVEQQITGEGLTEDDNDSSDDDSKSNVQKGVQKIEDDDDEEPTEKKHTTKKLKSLKKK